MSQARFLRGDIPDDGLIDPVAIERAMKGDRVALTVRERVKLLRRMAARGFPDERVGELMGASDKTVWRVRHELGIESGWVG